MLSEGFWDAPSTFDRQVAPVRALVAAQWCKFSLPWLSVRQSPPTDRAYSTGVACVRTVMLAVSSLTPVSHLLHMSPVKAQPM